MPLCPIEHMKHVHACQRNTHRIQNKEVYVCVECVFIRVYQCTVANLKPEKNHTSTAHREEVSVCVCVCVCVCVSV